jgi:hypothetical protein
MIFWEGILFLLVSAGCFAGGVLFGFYLANDFIERKLDEMVKS